jgi:hypothetical protein
METKARLASLIGLGSVLALALIAAAAWTGGAQEIPGPLSAAHAVKPGDTGCAACHVAPGEVSPAKCLACHTEIATRVTAQTGFHRDKAEDCAVCHAEHQGRQANIVPLDPADFDHSETGVVLQGAHLRPHTCDACHTAANTITRSQGRSYLLKVPGCRGCHIPPHPGRQEYCADCHSQDSWIVDRLQSEERP